MFLSCSADWTISVWHLHSKVTNYTVLYCTVLYCTVLYCTVLYIMCSLSHIMLDTDGRFLD